MYDVVDSTRIKRDESGSGDNGEYRVDLSSSTDGGPAPEQLWNHWNGKRVQEDALKGAIAKGKVRTEYFPRGCDAYLS